MHMVCRVLWTSLLSGLCFQVFAAGVQKPAPPASKPAAQEQEKKDPFKLFHWLSDSSENQGLVVDSRQLASLTARNVDQPPMEVETEVVRPDAKSMRVTSRVYGVGSSGERTLNEVVVEDLRATAGNGISAVRSISRNDINGRLRVIQKETQDTVPAGPDTFRTQVTVMSSRGDSSMARTEDVVQVEKKKGAAVEIERTVRRPDVNGSMATTDRRVSVTRETNGELLSQEDIYRPDAYGKLALVQQDTGREWKDPQGRVRQDTDFYVRDLQGKLRLDARSNIVRSTYADGSEQTTQTLQRISPVTPSEGLKLLQKIVETSRPTGPNAKEKEMEVLVPDANGKLQSVLDHKTQEKY